MLTARRFALLAAVAIAFASATPAAASNFDEIVYIFMAGAVLLAVLAILMVLWLRKAACRYGAKADVVSAVAIAAILAPGLVRYNEYGAHFSLLPHWLFLLGGGWREYLPWPFLSFLATVGLIYAVFAWRRRQVATKQAGSAQ